MTLHRISQVAYLAHGLLMASSVFFAGARAHEAPTGWTYPYLCCSDRDCNMIPASRVTTGPEGYRVVLHPGDHDFIKETTAFLVPLSLAKDAPDNEYHICITPDMKLLCFFKPPLGF